MKITVDTQYSASVPVNTESTTTTYKPSAQHTGKVSRSGYTLDIADKVMDNEAYGGHGMTAEEIMQQAANSNAQSKKDFMIVMSSCVSGEDLQKMQEEGFNPGSVDVETYVTIVDQIKVKLAQAGVEVTGYNDDLDLETVEEIVGSRTDAGALVNQLAGALEQSDMPVTNENIEELVGAAMEASGIGELSEDAIKYLLVNQKTPTIENIYKAQYSSAENIRQSQGYYSEGQGSYGKYYAKKADSIHWENLEGRIDGVIKEAGLDTNADTKAQAAGDAKWLIASGIELNAANLAKVTELKNLPLPMNQDQIVSLCVTAMENGKSPAEADMRGERPIAEKAQEIMEEVQHISDEAVHETAVSGKEMNLKNLAEAQQQIDERQTDSAEKTPIEERVIEKSAQEAAADEAAFKELQAKRQLEEIRLIMTEQANRQLLKAGISIDTTELSKLVDALKTAEERMRAILFQGESTEENAARALIYEETLTKTKELADMPAAVIGKILSKIPHSTLLRIHEAGKELQQDAKQNPNQQEKASSAYETLMTEPRKDLGDRISKAFRNVDDILTDLGFETSEANRRAVRILGYNRMEINGDNIQAVKEADAQVTGVISRMTPATTLQMIRDQKNPLEMTMEELDAYLNEKGMEPEADAERFSKFLQRLDRSGGIDADEREAYIGIYRMFRQIEKADGAVIGNIVATGAQMNFKNMLSAVRTNAGKNMDVRVDDGFGGLEELISKGKAIDTQINTGFQKDARQQQESDAQTQEQQKYYARLSGEINEELAEKTDLAQLDASKITAETTIEAFADTVKMTRMSENSAQRAEEKAADLKNFRDDMRSVEQIDDQIIESLIEYGQSISVDNIQAASNLIFDRGSLFRQILTAGAENAENTDDADDTYEDSSTAEHEVLQKADHFVEHLTDTKQAGISYQEMIQEANKAVEQIIYTNGSAQIDVKAAKALYKGLSLAGNLAREENYEVPMNIRGEITSVNLKIYHNASQTGKVAITLDTESLGKVAAEFDVTKDRISGMIVYENQAEQAALAQVEQAVRQEFGTAGEKQAAISLVHTRSVDLNKFGQDRDQNMTAENTKVSTSELYHTAKAFLTALRDL